MGLIGRAQLLAATTRANHRLEVIGAELDTAAKENVLAPLVAADNAAAAWQELDLSRKRAVIKTLMGQARLAVWPGWHHSSYGLEHCCRRHGRGLG